jgi:ABC-type proline/glycine betaine transport system substrate-binding protein
MADIAMENHPFQWENPLFLWQFSIAMLNYQRVILDQPGSEKSIEDHPKKSELVSDWHIGTWVNIRYKDDCCNTEYSGTITPK